MAGVNFVTAEEISVQDSALLETICAGLRRDNVIYSTHAQYTVLL